MVEAVAAGVIDFTQADPMDSRRWLHVAWMLDAFGRSRTRAAMDARREELLAVSQIQATCGLLDANGRKRVSEDIADMGRRHAAVLLPWEKAPDPAERLRTGMDAWAEVFGDPDSPETQARLALTLDWLKRHDVKFNPAAR